MSARAARGKTNGPIDPNHCKTCKAEAPGAALIDQIDRLDLLQISVKTTACALGGSNGHIVTPFELGILLTGLAEEMYDVSQELQKIAQMGGAR